MTSEASVYLNSGDYAYINTRFNKPDWTNYSQSNDWSYAAYTSYTTWKKITAYYDGILIWGFEPGMAEETSTPAATSTATLEVTYTQTPTITCTPSGTSADSATMTPVATATETASSTPVSEDITTSTATPTYTETTTPTETPTATGIAAPEDTATLTATQTATVTNTITATFTGTITSSITASATPSVTRTLTVTYTYSSTSSLTPTPTFTLTYSSSASMTLKYKTAADSISTNSPHPWFRLYNNGTSDISMSRVEIRYWYKFEGSSQTEQAYVDSSYHMPSGTHIDSYVHITITSGTFGTQDRCLKLTFDAGAGTLNADSSAYVEMQNRFNKSDWSNYDQSNDYSFANYSDYTASDYIGVYIDGNLVWGTAPGNVSLSGYISSSKSQTISKTKAEALNEKNCFNYPNPFSGTTAIRFSMDKPGDVKINITDINGKLVWHKSLKATDVRAGINEVVWKGTNDRGMLVSNGIYGCDVSTGKKSVRKTMALIK